MAGETFGHMERLLFVHDHSQLVACGAVPTGFRYDGGRQPCVGRLRETGIGWTGLRGGMLGHSGGCDLKAD